ncbi:hypothetical protein [Sandaracinus amylolyticus]|uniref:Uncharacterized protein n=1 Tax=Sandaracinus amylolyticus TaxID=927083 RepID=A0A0F6SDL2_9BACT|nr:hypothetical protein [Sandaracinus amylolyticus]AKF03639.1 hypothetical protein DB32_000788 [Sandaracinus amylolyticus]
MHAVAVTRARLAVAPLAGYRDASPTDVTPTREALARVIAELTGRDLYSVRLRLGQPLPWIVALEPDESRAHALVTELRRRGLGAVTRPDDAPWTTRHGALSLHDDALSFEPSGARIPYRAIRVVVLATIDEETSREHVDFVRVSNDPRSAEPYMPVSRYQNETSRSRAAYLELDGSEPGVRLVQSGLSLAGADPGRTSFERFDRALHALLARIPEHVPRDARLVDARRVRQGFALRNDGRERITSNVRETDLAARLLARAWLEDQIDPA